MTIETLPAPVETRERTASDVLLSAARYIEEHGWTQGGAWVEDDGRACIVGAIRVVTIHRNEGPGTWAEYVGAEDRLCAYLNTGVAESWNDEDGRTEAEVLQALRGAAR